MILRFLFMAFSLLILCGCSGETQTRFRLSGTATYDGKPIPFGDALFTPDGAKGNTGAQGIAFIRDGKFDTLLEAGKGVSGGPTVIRVTGLSGPNGKLICEFEYPVELPKADGKHDIIIPKEAGKENKGSEI